MQPFIGRWHASREFLLSFLQTQGWLKIGPLFYLAAQKTPKWPHGGIVRVLSTQENSQWYGKQYYPQGGEKNINGCWQIWTLDDLLDTVFSLEHNLHGHRRESRPHHHEPVLVSLGEWAKRGTGLGCTLAECEGNRRCGLPAWKLVQIWSQRAITVFPLLKTHNCCHRSCFILSLVFTFLPSRDDLHLPPHAVIGLLLVGFHRAS